MLRASALHGQSILESEQLSLVSGILHGFTTRELGSIGTLPARGVSPSVVLPDALDEVLGGKASGWTRRQVVQVHGGRAVRAGSPNVEADALVSSVEGELLVIRVADCLPILMVALKDDRPVAVAATHAGWRGLVAGIVEECVMALRREHPGASLLAALGPSIGPCCFEVGPEVASKFEALGPGLVVASGGDRSLANLPLAATRILRSLSVAVESDAPPCTRCDPQRFHSFRADGAAAGRMAGFIGLCPLPGG